MDVRWIRRCLLTLCSALCGLFCVGSATAQEVTLSLQEYHRLRELAGAPTAETPGLAFETVELDFLVREETVEVTQRFTLRLYEEEWQRVLLPDEGALVDVDWGAGEGRLERGDEGWVLKLRGRGLRQVRWVSLLPLRGDEGAGRATRRVEFVAPSAALVRGVLRGVEALEVESEGSVVLAEETEGEDFRRFVAAPGGRFAFDLLAARSVDGEDAVRFRAVAATALRLGRERRYATAWVRAEVRRGSLDGLRLALPDDFTVLGVEGTLAGWRVEGGELLVEALQPVTGDWTLVVELAAPAGDSTASPVASALLTPRGTEDLLLASKVVAEGDGLLEQLDPGAGRRPTAEDEQDWPLGFQRAPGRALRLPPEGALPRWQVTWAESTEVLVVQVDRLRVDALVSTGGAAVYELWAEVRSAGAGQLTVTLPAGARLLHATRDGGDLEVGQVDGSWIVPLALGGRPQVIRLAALLDLGVPDSETLEIPLPQLSAPAALVEVRALLPDDRRYALADPSRRGTVRGVSGQVADGGDMATLARQLGAVAPTVHSAERPLFERPPAFTIFEASWSALSKDIEPLRLRVDDGSSRKEWF